MDRHPAPRDPAAPSSFRANEPRAEGASRPRHRFSTVSSSAGKRSALLCVLLALTGLAAVSAAELLSRTGHISPPVGANVFAGACALVALAAGAHALMALSHHRSRRLRRRLLIGLPAAICTALAVFANLCARRAPAGAAAPDAPLPAVPHADTPEDNSLAKTGWYGEILDGGVLLVVTSFDPQSAESLRFNKGLAKPVVYATLSVINTGSVNPATLTSPQVVLHLANGQSRPSLSLPELSARGGDTSRLSTRLAAQHEVPLGKMIADIPICLAAPFHWSSVLGVEVRIGARAVTVPGRLMTAREKLQAARSLQPAIRRPGGTNVTAEAWYKDL